MDILTYPHATLLSPAREVQVGEIDSLEFQELLDRMIADARERNALGLAAPQIGVSKRVFVMRTGKLSDDFLIFINPVLMAKKERVTHHGEACLSVPGKSFSVPRCKFVIVDALDRNGKPFIFKTHTKITAFAVQHEMDHLDGVLVLNRGKEEK